MRVLARIARTGTQLYTDETGEPYYEHRPAEEVFHPDSLAAWVGAPVTIGHPAVGVTDSNLDAEAVGFVVDVRRDGRYLAATLQIHRADAVVQVQHGDLIEISCGYAVELEHRRGVNEDGEEFHAVQTNIRGNHVALLPKNAARCGPECRVA